MQDIPVSTPIDAVIMWVDGADPHHAAKLDTFLRDKGLSRKGGADKARFHNAGELDYCVTSLLKFAPWLRTIFIVTDQQRPSLLDKLAGTAFEHRVCLIDHRVIFAEYPECLPSFNSMAISSLLWRIPGIAEQFLYLNDDFMLIQPTHPQDFFRGDKVVLRGKWHLLPESVPGRSVIRIVRRWFGREKEKSRISFWELQQSCARLLGCTKKYFRLPHVPHAWKRSSWEKIFTLFPAAVSTNIHAQLRGSGQYVPEALGSHFHWRENLAVLDNDRTNVQLKPARQSLFRLSFKLYYADINKNVVFACVQSIEGGSAKKQQLIYNWLDKRIGSIDELI
ncbi:Stealth CR1 domain-containing protein [Cellvibrio mixtus]|uniref:Stealth CR1 domain-containing protein n=1 Tax=Cellvibrio mixtus TaxID=39650 RepID=UPI0005871851|nr:stealth family protein [Cellvibrio mixtus]